MKPRKRRRRVIDVDAAGRARIVDDSRAPSTSLARSGQVVIDPDDAKEAIRNGLSKFADAVFAPIEWLMKLDALPKAALIGYLLYRATEREHKARRRT